MRTRHKTMMDSKGNVTILLAVVMVAMLGFTALVIDVGMIFVEKARLDQALDAAALAGAHDLPLGADVATLSAQAYLTLNHIAVADATIEILDGDKTIKVSGNKVVKHFFAPVIGIDQTTVKSASKAIIGPAKSVSDGLRPLAISDYPLVYGDVVTLKEGAGDGTTGNYGAVSFGPTGASVFENFLLYGYTGSLSIGDVIQTEPGNMAGAISAVSDNLSTDYSTFDNYTGESKRLWTIPIVDTLDVTGRKDVTIIGFAQFFVESAQKVGGDAVIEGRFIKFVASGEIDYTVLDRGVYVSKLAR